MAATEQNLSILILFIDIKYIKMKFLPPGYNVKEIEKSSKNKWRWEWLSEVDHCGNKWGNWLRKPDLSGVAFCECCTKTIKYGSSGKKAVTKHADDLNHQKNLKTVKSNEVLPGSSKASKETESLQDRIASQRAIIAAFISEHCLPFSMAEDLLKLGKRLSDDKPALEKTTISRSSATYINTHGLAKNFKDEVKVKVKGRMLSLNLDEATNNNNDKVLNILIQYYDDDEERIALRHLGSCKQNRATAKDIFQSIEGVLSDYEISWEQVASILMDNCSTMRGVRGGVETLARERNPNLLDVSGDSVHMINNVAKVLLSSIDETIQPFCMDIYYDIEESPKVREIFNEIQALMNIPSPKHLVGPISSRFLQMQVVCSRFMELLDPLTLYYYSFLSEEDKTRYRSVVSQILTARSVSDEAQAAILLIQMGQESQQKSSTSNDRKQRISKSLFQNRKETIVSVNTFRGLLDIFQGYVKSFQSEKPMIHKLHGKMLNVTQEVLGMFLKPECIPDSVSELIKLDVTDRSKQKSDKHLGVGKFSHAEVNTARLDKSCTNWISKFYSNLRTGYVKAAQKLLQLPLSNPTIRQLSALDPELLGHSQVEASIKKLAKKLPALFSENDLGQLSQEVALYNVDRKVKDFAAQYNRDDGIDYGYWAKVFSIKNYNGPCFPMMKKLVSSLLTLFSGPLIESTFNIMDDIVEKDRTKLTMHNYEAVAIVKTVLRKKNIKSTDLVITNKMKKDCICAYSTYQKHLKKNKEESKKAMQDKLSSSIQLLKMEKAKKVAKLVRLRNRILNKETVNKKRKLSGSPTRKENKWKRIRTLE